MLDSLYNNKYLPLSCCFDITLSISVRPIGTEKKYPQIMVDELTKPCSAKKVEYISFAPKDT